MANYVIGDLQGCYSELEALLKKINFNSKDDILWFVGDLVNRGPQSLECVQFVKALGNNAVTVLGNHDLSCLAKWRLGEDPPKTLQTLFSHADANQLMDWMEQLPLAHYSASLDCLMVHAGVPCTWTLEQTLEAAQELSLVLNSANKIQYYKNMYGDEPAYWSSDLIGQSRLRYITNAFTRMRFCYKDGKMEFQHKMVPSMAPQNLIPWFNLPSPIPRTKILFGHWAALMGVTHNDQFIGLDTGCVWGHYLSAYRIEDGQKFQVASQQKISITMNRD